MKHSVRRILIMSCLLFPPAVVILYSLCGFFLLPAAVRWFVPRHFHKQFQCQARMGEVRANPFLLTLEVKEFHLAGPDGAAMAGFGSVFLDLEGSGLLHGVLTFREFRMEKPVLRVVFDETGKLNLAGFAPTSKDTTASDSKPLGIDLQTVVITGGEVSVTDKRQKIPLDLTFQDLNLSLNSLSTVKDQDGCYSLSVRTADGEVLQWQGEIALVPFHSSGKVNLKGIRAATLWEFVQSRLNLDAPAGTLDVTCDYRLDARDRALQLTLENTRMDLTKTSFRLTGSEKPFLVLEHLMLESARFDPATRTLYIPRMLGESGALHVRIDEAGRSNLEQILHISSGKEEKPPQEVPPQDFSPSPDFSPSVPSPWTVNFDDIEIKGISLSAEDVSRGLHRSAEISGLALQTRGRIEAGSGKTGVSFDHFELLGSSLSFEDSSRGSPLRAKISNLSLRTRGKLEAVSSKTTEVNLEDIEIKGSFLVTEDSSRVSPLRGEVADLSIHSKGWIELGSSKTGRANLEASLELEGLRLGNPQAPKAIFQARKLSMEGGRLDLGARTLEVSRFALSEGQADFHRNREGKINWVQFFAPKGGVKGTTGEENKASSKPSWNVLIKSTELKGFRCELGDYGVLPEKPLYVLENLAVKVKNVDGRSPVAFESDFRLGSGGKVSLIGRTGAMGEWLDAKLKVTDFSLAPLQPYLASEITLTLQSAAVSAEGALRFGVPGSGVRLAYDGSLKLDNLSMAQEGSKETYLGWKSLQVPQAKLTLQPNGLQIADIKLLKPTGQVIIAEDRTVNLSKIIKKEASPRSGKPVLPPKAAPKGDGGAFPFTIGKVVVEEGNVVFADLSLVPKFMTRIHGLKGTISRISSSGDTLAQIQLDGGVDEYGLAKVTGVLSLYDIKRSTNLDVVFRNVEMANITPYSGKFAGRRIKSGKLSLDLKYQIQENKLAGDNKIVVDNLVLGEQVQSPEAINLPLDLAVALLTDSKGRIDIGLPVSGDFNDPKFSLGPLIWKALTLVITKAVTAPFRALGSLFGGEPEKFEAVQFDPGKSELLPPEKEKLKKMADALQKRPQLKLIVQGRFSSEADGLELKHGIVGRSIAVRLGGRLAPDEAPEPPDFNDSKTRKALEKAYEERFGAPALDELVRAVKQGSIQPRSTEVQRGSQGESKRPGGLSSLWDRMKIYKVVPGAKSPEESALLASEIYFRLVESEPVPEKSLMELASNRARAICTELQNTLGFPAARLVTRDPESLTDTAGLSAGLSVDALSTGL